MILLYFLQCDGLCGKICITMSLIVTMHTLYCTVYEACCWGNPYMIDGIDDFLLNGYSASV